MRSTIFLLYSNNKCIQINLLNAKMNTFCVFKIIKELFAYIKEKVYLCSIIQKQKMKAVIYARVSSTTDRQSTDRQVTDLKKYASIPNWR